MGNYNPSQSIILGQEWVPIRDEDVALSPAVNAVEVGHGFSLGSVRQVRDARFYLNTFPAGSAAGQVFLAAIYPAGEEANTGPIQRLVIPCNNGGITGNAALVNATSVADALADPSDSKQITLSSTTLATVNAFFATGSYAAALVGKRILAVNVLYALSGDYAELAAAGESIAAAVGNNAGNLVFFGSSALGTLSGTDTAGVNSDSQLINRMSLGEIDPFWSNSLSPFNTSDRMPWIYGGLARFEASAGVNRNFIRFQMFATPSGIGMILHYLALEVLYCEERRIAYGGRAFGYSSTNPARYQPYNIGANVMALRTVDAFAADPILSAGDYTVTLSSASVGDQIGENQSVNTVTYPLLNGVRQLYGITPHPAVQVDIPFPIEDHVGETFELFSPSAGQFSRILPQLSLHASGGTLVEPHAYGRQFAGQVYGAITATQDIADTGVPAGTYEQVRYYARRFGDTSVDLQLTNGAGSTVTLTPSEWDELVEIIDGWKEVTLTFGTPPTMGGVSPVWQWSAAGEAAGSRWEVLGACAPAISGLPGNLLNQVLAPNQLDAATYEPPNGATINAAWMPLGCGSAYVTGTTSDAHSDFTLIFSQTPPAVTGVALTPLTQTVTGIGLNCGSLACCIPSGIAYQRVTWAPTTMPVSGFGAYELQRWDLAPDATFQTIMLATSPYVTGFNDYEARVGVDSVYRVRVLNLLNFAGAWSLQVTGSPPTPGVTGGCEDMTGALIFTSNADQSGALNVAYIMQWDGMPTEDFALAEAEDVTYQAMYGRDGSVAFHGTERGLEQFSRSLLIQAGAIDPIRLADVKTLRDLAWTDLPYICVRDDIGDRWFASVRVPAINVRGNRVQYMARVDIIETTRTAAVVDP